MAFSLQHAPGTRNATEKEGARERERLKVLACECSLRLFVLEPPRSESAAVVQVQTSANART
eukprot:11051281-Alexandrium_andersonii.AAC.1